MLFQGCFVILLGGGDFGVEGAAGEGGGDDVVGGDLGGRGDGFAVDAGDGIAAREDGGGREHFD